MKPNTLEEIINEWLEQHEGVSLGTPGYEEDGLLEKIQNWAKSCIPEKHLTFDIDFPKRNKLTEEWRKGRAVGWNRAIDQITTNMEGTNGSN